VTEETGGEREEEEREERVSNGGGAGGETKRVLPWPHTLSVERVWAKEIKGSGMFSRKRFRVEVRGEGVRGGDSFHFRGDVRGVPVSLGIHREGRAKNRENKYR